MIPRSHFHETLSTPLRRLFEKRTSHDLKIALWNAFVDSGLTEICDDDCSALPHILPLSYLPAITSLCRDLTEFLMKFLSFPREELERLLIPTPITDYLIHQLGALDHRKRRMVGSLRYDFALEGKPSPNNQPKLLEINDIGFDGVGRSSFMQETLFSLFPELRKKVRAFDTAHSEVETMRRLGRKILRVQYGLYNWEEEVVAHKANARGVHLMMVTPQEFHIPVDDLPLLSCEHIDVKKRKLVVGKDQRAVDAAQIGFSLELEDLREGKNLFRKIIAADTPMFSPLLTALIAPKSTLVTLCNETLQRALLGKARARRMKACLIPAWLLSGKTEDLKRRYQSRVIKHVDGMGGEQVFLGKDALKKLHSIARARLCEWVVQERVKLNTIDVDGFLSRPRRVISDVSAYVHYDWNGKRLTHFKVGGFITRATNRSLKVNVSGGGIQVPVMFDILR